MNLCEFIQRVQYDQYMYVYVTNIYGQNLCIGKGIRSDLLNEDLWEEFLFHLLDEVELITITADGKFVIRIKDKHFNERLESQYDENYAKKWKATDPDSRPFVFDCEMEDFK